MRRIGGFFGGGPFGPLHELVLKVSDCVKHLVPLAAAVASGDSDRMKHETSEVDRLEGEADDIKSEIRLHLSSSFIGSIQRAEVLLIVKLFDSIADSVQSVAKMVELRETPVPKPLEQPLQELVESVVKCVEILVELTAHVRESAESAEADVSRARELVDRVAKQEYSADRAERELLRTLFQHEKEIDPVSVMFLTNMIELIGHVADSAENSADAIRRMIAR